MIGDNQLLNAKRTNYFQYVDQINSSLMLEYYSRTIDQGNNISCSCGISTMCVHTLNFYCTRTDCFDESKPVITVPGIILGCLPVSSVLSSTLECFYNQSCVQMLIDWRTFDISEMFLPFTLNITALDPSAPSRFSPNTLLKTIVSQLLVEEWINTTDPKAHYEQCKPSTCTYTYTAHYNTFYVVTSVLGLLGGLSVILRLIVPFIVKLIMKLKDSLLRRTNHIREQQQPPPDHTGHRQNRIQFLIMWSRQAIISLNAFNNETDKVILATISYILLVGASFSIASIFVALSQETRSYTVVSPSESTFELLYAEYGAESLSCPCTQISMPYNAFLTLSTVHHQICSSDFILSDWWTLMWSTGDLLNSADQSLLSTYFRILSSMCTLSKETVENATDVFLSSAFINIATLGRSSFENRVQSSVNSFKAQTPMTFRRTLQFMREIFRANQLEDIFMSSWKPALTTSLDNYAEARIPVIFNNETCTCATSMFSSCWRPLVFLMDNGTNNISPTITFPGLIGGCLPIDGLRMSTLECFFDSICLNTLRELLNDTMVPSSLNISVATRFPHTTTTLGSIIDELFIEQWFNTSNYSSYYQKCSPRACDYKFVERNSPIYVITFLLGLYGGLTITIRTIVLESLRLFNHMRLPHFRNQRRAIRVAPLTSVTTDN